MTSTAAAVVGSVVEACAVSWRGGGALGWLSRRGRGLMPVGGGDAQALSGADKVLVAQCVGAL